MAGQHQASHESSLQGNNRWQRTAHSQISQKERKEMAKQKESKAYPSSHKYKGREIVIKPKAQALEATAASAAALPEGAEVALLTVEIDGRPIEVLQEDAGAFYSYYLPYQTYPTALDLAKDVIDHVPSFKSRPGKEG